MDAWPVFYKNTPVYQEYQSNDQNFLQHCPPGQGAGDCYFMNDMSVLLDRAARMLGLGERAMTGEIDEVRWTAYMPGPGEASMFGEGAFQINGQQVRPPKTESKRAVPNTIIACMECQGHRLEWTMNKMFGSWGNRFVYSYIESPLPPLAQDPRLIGSTAHAWDRFTLINHQLNATQSPWIGAIGNAHYPVNATGNYGFYNSSNTVPTNANDWLKYPAMTCSPAPLSAWPTVNCATGWNCEEQGNYTDANGKLRIRGYQTWLLEHMPHAASANSGTSCSQSFPLDKGLLNNWWRYLMDVDQFKWVDGRFNADWTAPTVEISGLEQLIKVESVYTPWVPRPLPLNPNAGVPLPARVHGRVGVKVKVNDENPIYRVDFYVDGQYYATDTLRPFTFDWDATGLSGSHTLQAKAYDMPSGFEGVSSTVSVTVDPVSGAYTPYVLLVDIGANPAVSVPPGGTVATVVGSPVSLRAFGLYQGEAMTYSAQNLPSGAIFNTTTGELTWTPTSSQNGAQWIRFIATNPAGDSGAFDVVIAIADPGAVVPPP